MIKKIISTLYAALRPSLDHDQPANHKQGLEEWGGGVGYTTGLGSHPPLGCEISKSDLCKNQCATWKHELCSTQEIDRMVKKNARLLPDGSSLCECDLFDYIHTEDSHWVVG